MQKPLSAFAREFVIFCLLGASFGASAAPPRTVVENAQTVFQPGEALKKFATPISKGPGEPYIGNSNKIFEMRVSFKRRRMRSIILIGEPGLGKTVTAEEFARQNPGFNVYLTQMSTFGASTSQGSSPAQLAQWEAMLNDVTQDPDAILFIDEAHVFKGSRLEEETKPLVASGKLRLGLITDDRNFREYFESDPATLRRYRPVKLDRAGIEQNMAILYANARKMMKETGVLITGEALEAIAYGVADFYPARPQTSEMVSVLDDIITRYKEDKSSDQIRDKQDEIGRKEQKRDFHKELLDLSKNNRVLAEKYNGLISKLDDEISKLNHELLQLKPANNGDQSVPKKLDEIDALVKRRNEAWNKGYHESASQIDFQIKQAQLDFTKLYANLKSLRDLEGAIGAYEVYQYFETRSNMPGFASENPLDLLQKWENKLKEAVVGQKDAITAVIDAQAIAQSGFIPQSGPRSVTLLTGVSGPRMLIARTLADAKYGSDTNFVVIQGQQLGEFAEMQLGGAGFGIKNSEEGGLMEGVRQAGGLAVLVFNNVDDIHSKNQPQIKEILTSPTYTDSRKRVTPLQGTDIILVASWGQEYALNREKWQPEDVVDHLGIRSQAKLKENEVDSVRENAIKELKRIWSHRELVDQWVIEQEMVRAGYDSEMRAAITSRVLITPATRADVVAITELRLKAITDRARLKRNIAVEFSDDIKEELVKQYYQEDVGYPSVRTGSRSFERFISGIGLQLGRVQTSGQRVKVTIGQMPDQPGEPSQPGKRAYLATYYQTQEDPGQVMSVLPITERLSREADEAIPAEPEDDADTAKSDSENAKQPAAETSPKEGEQSKALTSSGDTSDAVDLIGRAASAPEAASGRVATEAKAETESDPSKSGSDAADLFTKEQKLLVKGIFERSGKGIEGAE